jgi:CRP-like cAMP-binding protein
VADSLGKIFEVGEDVVRQGDEGDCMFVILDGRAEVIRSEGGSDLTVAVLEKGDIFGEMALIRKRTRSASVRALTPLRVMTVDRRTFLQRIQEDPSIALNLLKMMVDRVEALDAELTIAQSTLAEMQSASSD